jgi:hypothetical protein
MGLFIAVTVVLIVLDGVIYTLARIGGCSPAWVVFSIVIAVWSCAADESSKKVAAISARPPTISTPASRVATPMLPIFTPSDPAPISEPSIPYGCRATAVAGSRVVLCFDQG